MMRCLILASLSVCLSAVVCAQTNGAATSSDQSAIRNPQSAIEESAIPNPHSAVRTDPNKFAVIVSGVSGEEAYAKQFAGWVAELRGALTKRLGFAEDRVVLLTEKPPVAGAPRATAEGVRQTFQSLRSSASAESMVFVFFIGHGTFDGTQAKFNLVGPDLSATAYGSLINSLPARRVVVVNMASASGEFIKALATGKHVVITATRSGQEQNATRFAEHFIKALSHMEADTDQNKRISVLEAFNYATKLTAEWYAAAGRLATEHALLDDNGDGVGHATIEAGDGLVAKATYFDSPEQAARNVAEASLLAERTRLEAAVEELKTRKEGMKPDEYDAALEKVLVELAKVSRSIRANQK